MMGYTAMIRIIKKTWRQFSDDDGFMMAAALAYYTLFAIAPLLVVIISVVSLITASDNLEVELFNQLGAIMGSDRAGELQGMVRNVRSSDASGLATLISAITLIISSTAIVVQLKNILNRAWNVMKDPSLGFKSVVVDRLISFGFVLGMGFIFLVSLGFNVVASILSSQVARMIPIAGETSIILFTTILGLLVTFMMFYLLLKYLPDTEIHKKDLFVGAVVTTLLFAFGKYVIAYYLGNSNIGSTFGSAGALASFMIWVYYNAVILIIGAEFTQVYAISNSRSILPDSNAVKVERIIKDKSSLSAR